MPVWKSKFYGAFVLNHRVVLHAIDATPARWRGDAGSSPLDRARTTAASSPVHPTHWLISTQVDDRDLKQILVDERRLRELLADRARENPVAPPPIPAPVYPAPPPPAAPAPAPMDVDVEAVPPAPDGRMDVEPMPPAAHRLGPQVVQAAAEAKDQDMEQG